MSNNNVPSGFLDVISTTEERLTALPKKYGQLILVKDKGHLYFDHLEGRKSYQQLMILETEDEKDNLGEPIECLYFIKATKKLYSFQNGSWESIFTSGANGQGVPTGGTAGQVLVKKSETDYDTEWQTQQSDDTEFIFDAVFSQMCTSGEVGTLKNTNYDEIISKISAGVPVACRVNFGTGDRVDSNNEDYVVKSYGMLLLSNQIEFTMVRVNTLTLPEESVELIRVVISKNSQASATIYKKLLCTESLFWKKQLQSIELTTDAGGTITGGTANLSDGTTVPITVTVAQG